MKNGKFLWKAVVKSNINNSLSFPFLLSSQDFSLSEAFFESMSGITTTGSTVILNLDESDYLAKFEEPEEEYINNIIPKKSNAAKEYYDKVSLRYDLTIIFNYIKKIICILLQNGRRKN